MKSFTGACALQMGVLTALEERGSPEVGLLEQTKNPTCQAWGEIRNSRSGAQL